MIPANKLSNLHCDLDLSFYTRKSGGIDSIQTQLSTISSYNPKPINMGEDAPPQELPSFTSADRIRQLNEMDKVLRAYNLWGTIC